MGNSIAKDFSRRIVRYKKAVKYLDKCGKPNYEKIFEVNRIAGIEMSEQQLQQIPIALFPGREEEVRRICRESLINAIAKFEELVENLGGY